MFKGLKLGKSRKKTEKDEAEEANTATAEVTEEEKATSGDGNPEPAAGESQGQPGDTDDGEKRPGPHGPLGELSVEPGEDLDDIDSPENVAGDNPPEENAETVNLVEIKPDTDTPAGDENTGQESEAEEEKKEEGKSEDSDDSFNSLFADNEEEDNPLASLIESLPDVTASEIISDIAELREIMKEGH
jgi:hypothetical protein